MEKRLLRAVFLFSRGFCHPSSGKRKKDKKIPQKRPKNFQKGLDFLQWEW
jgi:hypothetical protein